MDLSDISPAAVVAQKMQATGSEAAIAVMRKVLDMQAQQGQQLAQMVDQAGGLGRNVDISA